MYPIIDDQQGLELRLAQDAAAKRFSLYPDCEWQMLFQELWLLRNCNCSVAMSRDGLLWGNPD